MPAGLSLAPFRDYLQAPEPTYIELDMSTRPAQRAELKALVGGAEGGGIRDPSPASGASRLTVAACFLPLVGLVVALSTRVLKNGYGYRRAQGRARCRLHRL